MCLDFSGILGVALLGVFLAPITATDNISERNQGNVGGNSHQSVNIDKQKQVVNVDNNNGWHSWNSIFDYRSGYAATRILSKKSCVVIPLSKIPLPDVTTLPQVIREKQKDPSKGPERKEVTYVVSPEKITDLSPYGKNIEALCRGIPTYLAKEAHARGSVFAIGGCFQADILCIVNLNLCAWI
ncbi:gastrokine-1 [Tiliqua scincoides]|uniref:gastrokine-1 n=1 Tax=Tiliqua scincoides TaxID=71010 RepID=UPI00346188C2